MVAPILEDARTARRRGHPRGLTAPESLDRWCADFFDVASGWWSTPAIGPEDERRVRLLRSVAPGPGRVLELGCGTGATAVATALAGYAVTGIDVSEVRTAKAEERLTALQEADGETPAIRPFFRRADFYTTELAGTFDVVTCWNGFGVGTDDNQRHLLRRIATEWLDPEGVLIMDVYSPWRWASMHGQSHEYRDLVCENRFDPVESRFEERWWRREDPDTVISQYGRCYSPVDFLALVNGLGLEVTEFRMTDMAFGVGAADTALASALLDRWDYTVVLRRGSELSGRNSP
ncbi:class I SAM-dependent methyltransferase [Streptomyces sp. NPDC087866]|uniref:class I SAM-dependent methyltransferase n=1 Tax=unclassified Streptomyces TaxID=2593676 RepID=UPI0022590FD1|nr:class I SAM-dependent methyltransferase [Streptomyces sp. NBC_01789]MCX4448249.1 class I SAM-dependent methyltransferase [Streptomyces sp. NBC_01789]